VESDSDFGGAFFPGKVGFSEEQVISKVKLVSVVESVEVFKEFFVLLRFEVNSVEKGFFISKHGLKVSLFQKVNSSLISFFKGLHEESVKIVPLLETDFVVVVSVGSLENKFDFSETHVVVLECVQEFVQHVMVVVSNIGEFSGNGFSRFSVLSGLGSELELGSDSVGELFQSQS